MKENIFRVLSFLLALSGLLVFLISGEKSFPTSISGLSMFIAFVGFLLFAIGGSKLLSKLPFTKLFNEKVSSFLTTGRDTTK